MSEERQAYRTELLQSRGNLRIIDTEADALYGKLRHVKVQLLSLLVELDRALGDEPSVKTRAERRGR